MNPHTWHAPEIADDGEDLRSLDWHALLARLVAERDLRREFAAGRATGHVAADFMSGAALVVGDSSHSAQSINPDTLANLKAIGGIMSAAGTNVPVAKLEARGKQ